MKKSSRSFLKSIVIASVIVAMMLPLCGVAYAAESTPSNATGIDVTYPLQLEGKPVETVRRPRSYVEPGLTYTDEEGQEYSIEYSKKEGWTIKDKDGIRHEELEAEFQVLGKINLSKTGVYLQVYQLGKCRTFRVVVVYVNNDRDDDNDNDGGKEHDPKPDPKPDPEPPDPEGEGTDADGEHPEEVEDEGDDKEPGEGTDAEGEGPSEVEDIEGDSGDPSDPDDDEGDPTDPDDGGDSDNRHPTEIEDF